MDYREYLTNKIERAGGFERYFQEKINQKMPFINILMENTQPKSKLLEAGFGSCVLSIYLSKKGYELTSIDIDDGIIELARKHTEMMGGSVKVEKGDIFKTGLRNKSFDVVFHQGVLEHFDPPEIIEILNEQKRVGNKIIFSVPSNRYRIPDMELGDERLWSQEKWRGVIKLTNLKIISEFSFPYFEQEHIGFVLE